VSLSLGSRVDSVMDEREFLQILGGFSAIPVEDVFLEYKTDDKLEWRHLICSIADFNFIFSCKDFKFYSLCRCHLVADDGSSTHQHVHAVVSSRVSLGTWKQRLSRRNIKLQKSIFKRILCADHLAGVLRYLCCKVGQRNVRRRRGVDGLVAPPHTHYSRRVDVRSWLHNSRGRICSKVRDEIEVKMKLKLNSDLHDYDTCICDRGARGIERREEANRMRRAFYDTEQGKRVKESYKRKKMQKDVVIEELQKLGKGPKAELKRAEIERLIKMLKG
jgi:hypothetical protein